MLVKCMLTPLKLARAMEWNGRLGKPSAIMAIDISNDHIGIALAYHQPQSLSNESKERYNNSNVAIATSITALPPIPYMSNQPYHPSYAFLNHDHSLTDEAADIKSTRSYGFDRVKRTMEIADQLALLAKDRKVKGILVRWPGDLASAVSGGEGGSGRGSNNDSLSVESMREEADEGTLLFRSAETDNRLIGGTTASAEGGVLRNNPKSDGSMGYMRGRILYVLDKCTAYHGSSKTNARSLGPLLVEKTRPFTLFDTSITEQNWIVPDRKRASTGGLFMRHNDLHPLMRREDKYGNSFTEADLWGRCPVFGNQPPRPQQGKHYYSSREKYSGYRVVSHFLELGNINGDGGDGEKGDSNSRLVRNDDNFDDNLHDDDLSRTLNQFRGSLSAMHALYDFANENLRGRIVLPSWASSSSVASFRTSHQGPLEQHENVVGYNRTTTSRRIEPGQLDVDASLSPSASQRVRKSTTIEDDDSRSAPTRKSNNLLATLVQTSKRKNRGKGKQEVNFVTSQ